MNYYFVQVQSNYGPLYFPVFVDYHKKIEDAVNEAAKDRNIEVGSWKVKPIDKYEYENLMGKWD